jgi:hypothetical protein
MKLTKIQIAINSLIDYKPKQTDKAAFKSLSVDFKNLEISLEEFVHHISLGHTFCPHLSGPRKAANFLHAQVLAVDIDRDVTLEDAQKMEIVQKYAAFIYTTNSHRADAHRFRIVFVLERLITEATEMTRAYRGLIRQLAGDTACDDAARMFFGAKGCTVIMIGNTLPNDQLARLIMLGTDAGVPIEVTDPDVDGVTENADDEKPRHLRIAGTSRSELKLNPSAPLRVDGGTYKLVADLNSRDRVHCPEHIDRNASAFVVVSRSGTKGVHCTKCKQTFWPKEHNRSDLLNYDFYSFERELDAIEYEDSSDFYPIDDTPPEYFLPEMRTVQRLNQKYLDKNVQLQSGVMLWISPKGSGKTELLVDLVQQALRNNYSILLVGHRQSLLSTMAHKLGLHFYKTKVPDLNVRQEKFQHIAICLDSIPQMLDTSNHSYDLVIIDESEQVFSHLTSTTLQAKRRQCYFKMMYFLRNAKTVIACDADLGYLTSTIIQQSRVGSDQFKYYDNKFKAKGDVIDLYESKHQLIDEMISTINLGGRHYICCNSKGMAIRISKILEAAGRDGLRVITITSENSQTAEIKNFLKNIKSEILSFDVLIASPSLGTGIDITFEEEKKLVDTVFGFFDAQINTHFDMDQQLSRVRHPGAVKAWITPEKFYFETEPEIIMQNCVDTGDFTDSLIGYDKNGIANFKMDDEILILFSQITSMTNASKNNLRKHFIELRQRNGWEVKVIENENLDLSHVSKLMKNAKEEVVQDNIEGICHANLIDASEYSKLNSKQMPTRAEYLKIQRYRIEKFYEVPITPEVVALDSNGKFRRNVHMLVRFMSTRGVMLDRDVAQSEKLVFERENNILKRDLLREIIFSTNLIDNEGNFKPDFSICSTKLGEFIRICKQKDTIIQNVLRTSLRADIFHKPISQLNNFLSLLGLKVIKEKKTESGGEWKTHYRIDWDKYSIIRTYADKILAKQTNPFEIDLDEETGEMLIKLKRNKHRVTAY